MEMELPVIPDFFCCAGGAAVGYHRAGFRVVGFDISPQPNYPFEFHQVDLVDPDSDPENPELIWPEQLEGRNVVGGHGSPPCQSYTDLAVQLGIVGAYPRLIGATRRLFERQGLPYVIENVEGAESDMRNPVTLCGTQFPGLRVLRHRLFETNWGLQAPAEHPEHPLVFTHDKRKRHYGKLDQNTSFVQVTGGGNCSIANAKAAMGIDWMTKQELNEALPPAYTEFIGRQLMSYITGQQQQNAA